MSKSIFAVTMVSLAGALTLTMPSVAAPPGTAGSLDPTFGSGGKTTLVGVNGVGNVAVQPDGKILIVAPIQNLNLATLAFGVVRLLPNGRPDGNFGQHGVVETAVFGNFINTPNDLAIQGDGKIVVVGGAQSADGSVNPVALARYNANGSLDTSFGNGGKVTTIFDAFAQANVVLIQPDGKILIGGMSLPSNDEAPAHAVLARYDSHGALDPTFGTGGKVTSLLGSITALALQSDGKILTDNGTPFVRVLSDGTIDATNTGGTIIATTHRGTAGFQPDGQYLVALEAPDPGFNNRCSRGDCDVQMLRYNRDRTIDDTFKSLPTDFGAEGTGPVRTEFSDAPSAFIVQPDGQIVVGGDSAVPVGGNNFTEAFGVLRFNARGAVDQTFGQGGGVTTRFSNRNGAVMGAITLQPDGKIVAVGLTLSSDTAIPDRLAVVRYLGAMTP